MSFLLLFCLVLHFGFWYRVSVSLKFITRIFVLNQRELIISRMRFGIIPKQLLSSKYLWWQNNFLKNKLMQIRCLLALKVLIIKWIRYSKWETILQYIYFIEGLVKEEWSQSDMSNCSLIWKINEAVWTCVDPLFLVFSLFLSIKHIVLYFKYSMSRNQWIERVNRSETEVYRNI